MQRFGFRAQALRLMESGKVIQAQGQICVVWVLSGAPNRKCPCRDAWIPRTWLVLNKLISARLLGLSANRELCSLSFCCLADRMLIDPLGFGVISLAT